MVFCERVWVLISCPSQGEIKEWIKLSHRPGAAGTIGYLEQAKLAQVGSSWLTLVSINHIQPSLAPSSESVGTTQQPQTSHLKSCFRCPPALGDSVCIDIHPHPPQSKRVLIADST